MPAMRNWNLKVKKNQPKNETLKGKYKKYARLSVCRKQHTEERNQYINK